MKFPRISTHVIAVAAAFGLAAAAVRAQTPIGGPQTGTLAAGVYHTTSTLSVAAATTWTLNPGVIIKFTSSGHNVSVAGTLTANGTSGNPVIFTAIADDSAGGDTNGNGPSSGAPAAWSGIIFAAGSGGSLLNHASIRFGGSAFISNVELQAGVSPTFTNCTILGCFVHGMDLNGSANPTVSSCAFTNNSGNAIEAAPITALANFTNNTATGNLGNFTRVSIGTVASNLSIASSSNINGATVIDVDVAVAPAATLTIGAGVVFKMLSGAVSFNVDGLMFVNGVSGTPVVFTSFADDSVAGDTNNNGPSAGAPAGWEGLRYNDTSDGSIATYAEIRYGGASFVSNLELTNANVTFTNCTIRHCFVHGMDLNANSNPTVTSCTFQNNAGHAVDIASINAIPGFINNTATGNGSNSIRVTSGMVSGVVNLIPESHFTGAIVTNTTITIPAGAVLNCSSGVVVKFQNGGTQVTVDGTLNTNGTAGNKVVFTAYTDDSAGGDTDSNGLTSGTPAAWQGIVFNAGSGASIVNHADIRYGGASFVSNVELNSASPTITNSTIRNCFTHGMDLNANSTPTVSNCTFTSNSGYAVDSVAIGAVNGFSNNVASGNGANSLRVTSGTLAANAVVNAASMLTGAILVAADINVPAGRTLTLNAGTIIKFEAGNEINVAGTLVTNGTMGAPVIVTDSDDDTAGGDTNSNGAATGPSAASLRGVVFTATSTGCVLNWAEVRYGGSAFVSNVECSGANPTLTNCTIRNCFTHGMDLNANSRPTVTNCTFLNNAGAAVESAELEAVSGFVNNSASGNGGNFIRITDASVTTPVIIPAESCLGGALVVNTNVVVQLGGTLTMRQGVVMKIAGGNEIVVHGAANFLGTTYEPVVLTSMADDAFGGDTNNNGPSTGASASWRGVAFAATAGTSLVENTRIRYTGASFVPGFSSLSANVSLRGVRSEFAFNAGMSLSAAASATNLVANNCGGNGIHLTGGSFDLVHATSSANAVGVRAEAAWTGFVRNSIAYGNTGNFQNFGAGTQVTYSNGGFAGLNSNINADPLFVSPGTGDFALQAGSPCIDVADPFVAFAVARDHAENSRILDSELTGVPGADMGAFEHPAWEMTVAGTTRIGTSITFTITGPAGDTTYLLGILDGVAPFSPYGILLSGAIPYVSVIVLTPSSLPVGTPVTIPLPYDPSIVGIVAAIQTLTTPAGDPAVGNFTRLYRALVRP